MNEKEAIRKIVLALDVDSEIQALKLCEELKSYVGLFKIGSQLFTRFGPSMVKKVIEMGAPVFLDLKFHDIPNTVAMAAREAVKMGVGMFNVHACGGVEMMKQTAAMVEKTARESGLPEPVTLAVTILTSMSQDVLENEVRCSVPLESQVLHYASLAGKSGLKGVVASPHEIQMIRKQMGPDFVILTPGIRPQWSQKNDQKRVMTPGEAIHAGADYIVIGRPILADPDPLDAAKRVVDEILSE